MPATHSEHNEPFGPDKPSSVASTIGDHEEGYELLEAGVAKTSAALNSSTTKTTVVAMSSSSSSSTTTTTTTTTTKSSNSQQTIESHVQIHTSPLPQKSAHNSNSNKLFPFLRYLTPEWRAALLVCLRSYGIGYIFATAPKLIKTVIAFLTNPRRAAKGQFVLWAFIKSLLQAGLDGFSSKRDGMSMLLLFSLGGHRVLDLILTRGIKKTVYHQQQRQQHEGSLGKVSGGSGSGGWQRVELDEDMKQRITTLSSFIASAAAITFMHRKRPHHATIDYTLFAVVRALDVIGHMAVKKKWGPSWLERYGSVLVFQLACTEIMFAWLYEPERLPGPYAFWITRMSRMDARLLQTLRGVRKGEILFGPGQAAAQPAAQALLTGLCNDLKLPESLGSLDQNKLPCTLVHQGIADTCE
ncbi:hypothetical protein BGW42_003109, partial [Actinomortierella wolfii]